MSAGEKYTKQMGQYPVIHFSMKSAKQADRDTALDAEKADCRRIYPSSVCTDVIRIAGIRKSYVSEDHVIVRGKQALYGFHCFSFQMSGRIS